MPIPVENFTTCDGSVTSEDGLSFFLHAKRDDGSPVMLSFPHEELPNIVEAAAMQMDKGKSLDGERTVAAFQASGFSIGKGLAGETLMRMEMREGGRMCFLLHSEMIDELIAALGRTRVKH
jgi:hypothetical protein